MLKRRPIVCITTGDPSGIGPEVVSKALSKDDIKKIADYIVVGSAKTRFLSPKKSGQESIGNLEDAYNILKRGEAQVLVTAPVSKRNIIRAGVDFVGQTEHLAGLCGVKRFAMMFISKRMKITLVTRHIRLSEVTSFITSLSISTAVRLTYQTLKLLFGIANPKIGISGINPHCGEGGLIGDEELTILQPVIRRLKKRYPSICGPIPADTLFFDAYNGKYDCLICMFHDQALPAFKMLCRDIGVNLTVGLPFIRTSPDHGTGFDIAGCDKANPGSMVEAIRLAVKLWRRKERLQG